jgi:hypothetical protein
LKQKKSVIFDELKQAFHSFISSSEESNKQMALKLGFPEYSL